MSKNPSEPAPESSLLVAKLLVISGLQAEALQLAQHGIFGNGDGEDDLALAGGH